MMKIVKGPYLQRPTMDSMTIMWETSERTFSKVEVLQAERIHSGHQGNYKQPEHIIRSITNETSALIHEVTIDNLEPSTIYFYKIYAGDSVEGGPFPFKTAVRSGESFSFAVTSETGGYSGFDSTDGQINRNIFKQMSRYRPDLALFIGDVVDDGQRYEDWEQYFFGPGKELFHSTPVFSFLGNHENQGSWYYDFFAFNPPKNYYSFDYGDAHFICLDATDFIPSETYPHLNGQLHCVNPQIDFLLSDLQATTAKWKIVYFHYPPYVSGGYQVEDLRVLSPFFEQYGVDLVFNSHTIIYERSHPLRAGQVDFEQGVVYIVAGGAGAMENWLLPKREWHTSQAVAVPHFVQVVVTSDRLEVRAIDEEGRLFDTLQIRKSVEGKKSFF
ncbi:metallophosphoesterase family protein [Paenibacillus sp. N1-5-1-14]|uniref:purple acid phosphatase family protein n=1 Tax=Paenibacillus radicibacter TaxID=2972488 RepID=UPI0021592CEE|nr:metallophosphoesterase family protein [Paenibacillus radicibacter]MCR8644467.1 metallophosphoesterase family protein [Paenibacillus radicibacter]